MDLLRSTGQVWYSFVSGNQDGKFNISREGGVVTLVSPLDFEVSQQYKLVVRAADSGPAEPDMRAAYFTFIVNVVDLNDNPPRFSQEIFHEDVLETSAVGKCELVRVVRRSPRLEGVNSSSFKTKRSGQFEFWGVARRVRRSWEGLR